MNERPTPVMVFGILNIIFGVLRLLGAPFSFWSVLSADPTTNPAAAIYNNQLIRNWTLMSGGLALLTGLVLVIAGIGLLQMRSWARALSIGYGGFAIILGVITTMFNVAVLMPATMTQMQGIAGNSEAARMGGLVGGAIGVLGGILGLVYPVLLLIFMTRPHIIAAFEGQNIAAPVAPTVHPREF